MTNAEIIFNESINLMNQGIIKGTGEFATFTDDSGNEFEQEIPEEIHTFNGWKERGYSVKKGAKSEIKFAIWKHTRKFLKEDTENEEINKMNANINAQGGQTRMFMTMSAFFTMDQVEPIKAKA